MNADEFYDLNKDEETERYTLEAVTVLQRLGVKDDDIKKILAEVRQKTYDVVLGKEQK